MNINSHIKNIKELLIGALTSEKEILIKELTKALRYSTELLKTDELAVWENFLKENRWELIPTTKAAVKEELGYWQNYEPSLKTLVNRLQDSCEKLLIYWREDDLCEMQGQFFFYKEKDSNKVFKESQYGNLSGIEVEGNEKLEAHIALIPDLENSALLKEDFSDKLYL